MEHEFWHARWQQGQIGFHEGAPNAYLAKHHAWLEPCKRILVPLCGKTEDLAFLAGHGHEVVGVELVEDAVRQFFAEHGAQPVIEPAGDALTRYTGGAITIFAGDFFATTAELVGAIDGIYDRGALVALPPDLRTRYVAHLRTVAPAATRELLVSIEYPEGALPGPPFSILEAEVRERFPGAQIEDVGSRPDPQGRLDGKMGERCYQIAL